MKLVGSVTTCLEISFTTCKSFKDVLELIDKVIESCSKYHDYVESNLVAVTDYQSLEGPNHVETIIQLLHFDGPLVEKYKSQIESSVVETIKEKLDALDFYKPLCLDEICPKGKAHHYIFLKHVKENGFSIKNVILFTKHCGPASGYMHFVWKEEGTESLTNRQETINNIEKNLPKFFSCAHEAKSKALVSLLMHDQVSSAQFHSLYTELTGDCSIADNANSKAGDERMQLILETADESILRDLRVNNGQTKSFDAFWDIAKRKVEELQAAAVDDHRHAQVTKDGDVVSNLALAISARDLYEQRCKTGREKGLSLSSLSWFRFQIWPKNPYTHFVLNYMG